MSNMKTPTIFWRYQYVNDCDNVLPTDNINVTPDYINRWQIIGYIKVKVGDFDIEQLSPIAYIKKKGCQGSEVPSLIHDYCCSFPSFYDLNSGFGVVNYFGLTPNEVMLKVELAFNKTFKIWDNSI